MSAAAAPKGELAYTYQVLRRFDPRGGLSLFVIGALSFATGLTEAGVLASITSVAVRATGAGDASLGPIEMSSTESLVLAAVLLVANALVGVAIARASSNVSASSALAARQQLIDAYHGASFQRKSEDRVAALQEVLTTYVDRFTSAFSSSTVFISSLLSVLSFAASAILISPLTAAALALVGALVIAIQRPMARLTKRSAHALARQRSAYAEAATESVLLGRELAVFGRSQAAGEHLLALDRAVAEHFRRTRFLVNLTPRLYQVLAFAMAIAGMAVITEGEVGDLAGVAAVALILLRSLSYGQALVTNLQSMSEQRPYLERLVAMIEDYQAAGGVAGTEPIESIEEVVLDDVSFGYDPSRPVLRGVDLTIRAGETVGIVGPSGAGKTTLANLLLRLYEPTGGRLLVNGVPLAQVADESWHGRTAIVPQEPRLLHASVADNIRFLRPLPDEAVEGAAEEANVAAFVRSLPEGFDAQVGELGQRLSGGQRQRICIARALAGRPDLLVLDEPTSALDGESEAAVQKTLEDLKGRVTMVIVAHRLSTLAICDRIVVVTDGTIAAVGAPEELRRTSTYFREALAHAGL